MGNTFTSCEFSKTKDSLDKYLTVKTDDLASNQNKYICAQYTNKKDKVSDSANWTMDSDKNIFFDIDNPDHRSRDRMVKYMTDAGLCVPEGTLPCPLPENMCDADDGVYTVARSGGKWFHLTKLGNGTFHAINTSNGETALLTDGKTLRGSTIGIVYKPTMPAELGGKVVLSMNEAETLSTSDTKDYYSVLGYRDGGEIRPIGTMVGIKTLRAKEFLSTGELFNQFDIQIKIDSSADTVEPFTMETYGYGYYQSPFGSRFV